jgi:lipopolysaccharide biosynthesis glycosyltransferase
MSLIVNLGLTQRKPLKVILIYFASDMSTTENFIELINNTRHLLENEKSLVSLEYRIVETLEFDDLVGEFGVPQNSHITKTAYLRYFLDLFTDENSQKLLYLDIDVLVRKDISELFDLNFDEVIAASLASPKHMAYGEHLENFSGEYFNSGVLLINMDKWRGLQIGKKLVNVTLGQSFQFLDQDALNIVFQNNWKKIDRKYNWFHDATKRQIEIIDWPEPSIIHFVGLKPWQLCDETEYVFEYRDSFERIRVLSKVLLETE